MRGTNVLPDVGSGKTMKKRGRGGLGWLLSLALCAILLAVLPALPVRAEEAEIIDSGTCGDDLTWTLDSEGTLSIVGSGEMWDMYDKQPWNTYSSQIRLVVLNAGVTSIKSNAFFNCTHLERIVIPASVTSIDPGIAFFCSSLEWYQVDAENPAYSSIDGVLFNLDRTRLVLFPAGKSSVLYEVPEGVITIGNSAFYNCWRLTSVILPSSLECIENQAFSMCSRLEHVEIPANVSQISENAYAFCTGVSDYQVNNTNKVYCSVDGVLYSSDMKKLLAYPAKSSRTAFAVPDGVTDLGFRTFYTCENLKEITLPESLTRLDTMSFSGCSQLTDIYFNGSEKLWSFLTNDNELYGPTDIVIHFGKDDKFAIIVASGKCGERLTWSLNDSGTLSVYGEGDMEDYSATPPPWSAFNDSIKSMVIEDGVTSVGEMAFVNPNQLTSILIPSSICKIGFAAFNGSRNLKEVYFVGAPEDWNQVDISGLNKPLISAYIHNMISSETDTVVVYHCIESLNPSLTVTAQIIKKEAFPIAETVQVFCALYNNGQFAGVRMSELEADGRLTFTFDDVEYTDIRFLFADGEFMPLCEALTAK